MEFGEVTEHESYGMVGIVRTAQSGPGTSLFGSSIKHSNTIHLRIKKAKVNRHLNQDRYHGKEQLIDIELSPTQFAEMITSLNIGDGVPCTLRYIKDHKLLEDPPEMKQREIFEQEFQTEVDAVKNLYQKEYVEVKNLLSLKGPMKVSDKKKITSFLFELTRIIDDHLPFLQKSFNESIDKTVLDAKGEVEAFVMNKVTSLGLKGLQKQLISLPEVSTEEEP